MSRRNSLTRVAITFALLAAGCNPLAAPESEPTLPDPAIFALWPAVTEKPAQVSPQLWLLCRALTPIEAQSQESAIKAHGPHAQYTIVVRVIPGMQDKYASGQPMPVGATVVKERYIGAMASGPMQGYAVMTKRNGGYFPDGGDWEYAFVTCGPEPQVTRGRLAECANCHASARGSDYLFRSYGSGAGD